MYCIASPLGGAIQYNMQRHNAVLVRTYASVLQWLGKVMGQDTAPPDGAGHRPALRDKGERMALTNRMLKTMGIEEDQRDQIMEAHQDTLREIREERDQYRKEAERVPELQRQLQEAQEAAAEGDGADEWKAKYEAEHKALEDLRAEVAEADGRRAKDVAYRKLLAGVGVDPRRVDAVMRVTDLSKVELDGNGGIKDSEALSKRAAEEWSDFVVSRRTEGDNPENPPTGGTGGSPKGVSDIAAKVIREHNERMYGAKSEE